MANYYGVNYTKYNDPSGSNITDPGELEGKVRVMTDSYEASAVAAGSIIYMGKPLPVGARVLDVLMGFDALGSATIKVGDADDDDRYIDAASVSSAGVLSMVEGANVDGIAYEVLGTGATQSLDDRSIILTTASAAITGTIKIVVYYTLE